MAARLMVIIRTFNLRTGELDSERMADLNSKAASEWFRQHYLWALLHGFGIQVFAERDVELEAKFLENNLQ